MKKLTFVFFPIGCMEKIIYLFIYCVWIVKNRTALLVSFVVLRVNINLFEVFWISLYTFCLDLNIFNNDQLIKISLKKLSLCYTILAEFWLSFRTWHDCVSSNLINIVKTIIEFWKLELTQILYPKFGQRFERSNITCRESIWYEINQMRI